MLYNIYEITDVLALPVLPVPARENVRGYEENF